MIYTIDETNVIRVWATQNDFDSSNPAILVQPDFPNGDEWTAEEASAWAAQFILSYEDPTSAKVPGNSKAEPITDRVFPTRPDVERMTADEFDLLVQAKVEEILSAQTTSE